MAGKFTPQMRADLLEHFAAGCSVPDAARAVGLREPTLKSWITRGRRETAGDYAEFVAAVAAARDAAKGSPGPLTAEEHRIAVSNAVRRGSVAAMKLYWDMIARDRGDENTAPPDPLSKLDELAERRGRVAAV